MKKIFGFLLAFVVALSFTGNLLAQDVHVRSGAKVRYMIEKKTVTKDEADTYASQGYVDLWAYALFNVGYWEKSVEGDDLIVATPSGTIDEWNISFTPPTHSFMICDKNGDYQPSGSVLFSQPYSKSTCGSTRTQRQRNVTNGAQAIVFIQSCCPTYAYGNSPSSGSSTDASKVDIYTDENGDWYRLKLFTIKYDYTQAVTFNTRFWSSYEHGNIPPSNLIESPGASTFTLSYGANPIKGLDSWTWTDQDWQNHLRYNSNDLFGFVTGGIEIIADPEFSLAASATCGGSDLQGSFKVNNWNGKNWSNYTKASMYVNTNGGTRKALAIGTDLVFSGTALCNASGTITATGTTADFNYTLASSAYMMNGAPADSLIWAFEDEKSTLI